MFRFTDNYEAEWYTYDDGSGDLKLRVTFRLKNLYYSSWTSTDGSFGHWLSIGFGTPSMPGADIVMCLYRYRGTTANEKFVCFDRFANQKSMPIDDQDPSVVDIDTITTFDQSAKRVTLSAIFERPLSGDMGTSNQDFEMSNGATFDAIWAQSPIVGGQV